MAVLQAPVVPKTQEVANAQKGQGPTNSWNVYPRVKVTCSAQRLEVEHSEPSSPAKTLA